MIDLDTSKFIVGKYEGKTIKQVYEEDEDYLRWALYELECKENNFSKLAVEKIYKTLG